MESLGTTVILLFIINGIVEDAERQGLSEPPCSPVQKMAHIAWGRETKGLSRAELSWRVELSISIRKRQFESSSYLLKRFRSEGDGSFSDRFSDLGTLAYAKCMPSLDVQ